MKTQVEQFKTEAFSGSVLKSFCQRNASVFLSVSALEIKQMRSMYPLNPCFHTTYVLYVRPVRKAPTAQSGFLIAVLLLDFERHQHGGCHVTGILN